MRKQQITLKINLFLGISLLFVFQAGGIILWFNVFPGSKNFMIIPFNLFGLTTNDFEPFLSAIFFGVEPILIVMGEYIGLRKAKIKEY